MKEYILNIQGYYRDESRKQFPNKAAVYFVYRGVYNAVTKSAVLRELIYIGETHDLNERFNEHNRREDFLERLTEGESIFYSFALVNCSPNERKIIESAFLNEITPPLNERQVNGFAYDKTLIHISGDRHAYIPNVICQG